MKTRWMNLIAGFTMFALCISIFSTTSSATVIWQDNFDDGNLDGWTIFAYEGRTLDEMIEGNISATNFMMEVHDDDVNVARHDSTMTVGTWSFDMFVPDDDDGSGSLYVNIISNGSRPFSYASTFIAVGAWITEDEFLVWHFDGLDGEVCKFIYVDVLQGWHHIAISRTSDGHFYVFMNGTFRAEFDCNQVTSSTYLEFFCTNATGAAIDNLVLDDTITTTTTTTSSTTTTTTTTTTTATTITTTATPPTIPIKLIALIGGFAVVMIVIVVFLREDDFRRL